MAVEGGGSSGASAGAIRAGKAVVEVSGDVSPLQASLARAKSMVHGLGGMLKGLGKFSLLNVGLAGAGLTAGYETLKSTLMGAVDYGANMAKLSDLLGASVEETSKLAYAFKTAGVEADEFEFIAIHLQKSIVEAADSGSKSFQDLGLDAKKMAGQPITDAFEAIANRLNEIPNINVRNAAAMEMFGKRGGDVLKMYQKGIGEMKEEAVELGYAISKETAQGAKDFKKSLFQMGESFESIFMAMGLAMTPPKAALKDFVATVKTGTKGIRDFLSSNAMAVKVLGSMGMGLVVVSASLLVLKKTLALVGAGMSVAFVPLKLGLSLVGLLVSALMALTTPLGLIVLAIGGLAAAWRTQTESGKQFAVDIGSLFGEIAGTAKEAWSGIVDAVKAGDLELAGKIACKGLQVVFLELTNFLTKYWNKFKDHFLDSWKLIVTGIADDMIKMPGFFGTLASVEEAVGMNESAALDRNAAEMLRKDPAAVRRELFKGHAEDDRASQASRAADMKASLDALAAAKAELSGLNGKAKVKAGNPMKDHIKEEADKAAAAMKGVMADAVKGGFGVTSGQFTYGDAARSSLVAQERAAAAAEEAAKVMKEVNASIKSLKIATFC